MSEPDSLTVVRSGHKSTDVSKHHLNITYGKKQFSAALDLKSFFQSMHKRTLYEYTRVRTVAAFHCLEFGKSGNSGPRLVRDPPPPISFRLPR